MTTVPATPEGVGNFNVETMMVRGEAVLRLSGELDLHSAEAFGEAARLVHAQGIPNLILDLSALEFIDSSGLHQFVVSLKRQREIGGDVVLRAPSDPDQARPRHRWAERDIHGHLCGKGRQHP